LGIKTLAEVKLNGIRVIELPYVPLLEDLVVVTAVYRLKISAAVYQITSGFYLNVLSLIVHLVNYEKILKRPKGTFVSFDENNPTIVFIVNDRMLFRKHLQDWIDTRIYPGELKETGIEVLGVGEKLILSEDKFSFLLNKPNLLPPFAKIDFGNNMVSTIINCQTTPSHEVFMQMFNVEHVNNIIVVLLPQLIPWQIELYLNITQFFIVSSFTMKDVSYFHLIFSCI
jgi:hypothetical protein